jgi:hypothetical protein
MRTIIAKSARSKAASKPLFLVALVEKLANLLGQPRLAFSICTREYSRTPAEEGIRILVLFV